MKRLLFVAIIFGSGAIASFQACTQSPGNINFKATQSPTVSGDGRGDSFDGKPDFEGVFGSQFVESKGGGEAQNSEWDPLRNFEEGLIDGDWGFFCAVQTAPYALDLAGFSEIPEVRTGYGEGL